MNVRLRNSSFLSHTHTSLVAMQKSMALCRQTVCSNLFASGPSSISFNRKRFGPPAELAPPTDDPHPAEQAETSCCETLTISDSSSVRGMDELHGRSGHVLGKRKKIEIGSVRETERTEEREKECAYVCVCVREREKEREKLWRERWLWRV